MTHRTHRGTRAARLRFESLEDRRVLASVPTGFTESVLAADLTSPTTMDIEESGRIWVAFQDGRIGVIEDGVEGVQLAHQLDADGSGERGLQGIELDPDFENNHYIYVYYTAQSPQSHNRLSRLTVDPTTENTILAGSEVVLLDLPNLADYGDPPWHIGGAIHFGLDGTLYVQVGESQQAALSQDMESPLGKVLRVNPDGSVPTDNPYFDLGDGVTWRDYIWASGLRNPFAGDLNPITGQYVIADVGAGSWEELNDATEPGQNFGWPSTEGEFNQAIFPDFSQPLHAYTHSGGDCAVTGAAFNIGGTAPFPSEYDGMLFFAEFCGGEIRVIDPENPTDVEIFATGADFPMNMEFGPDGALYYISRGAGAGGAPGIETGTVRRIAFAEDSPPSVVINPADTLVSAGYDAVFSVSAAGTTPLSYQWQVSTGGAFADIPGAAGPTLTLSGVALDSSGNQYRVVVSNTLGSATSAAATLSVTADTPPTPFITSPTPDSTYRAGDLITFAGGATDLEDGTLDADSLTWRVDFHHNTHSHPFIAPTTGIAGGQFEIPEVTETDDDVWYRITLTVTDSAGLTTSTFVDVDPLKSFFAVETNLPDAGGQVIVDGAVLEGPYTDTGVENVVRFLEVPEVQVIGEEESVFFYQWLDGETSSARTISTPEEDTAFVALYQAVGEDSSPLVNVNFQLDGVPTPEGYLVDSGLVFGDRGNGWDYGWSSDHTDLSRDRGVNEDQLLDTLVHFHAGQNWEIALPDGEYVVTVSIGDAGFPSTHTLNVEGVSYWDAYPTDANQFETMTQVVFVDDGRLTLDMGGAADKSTRVNYIEISEAGTVSLLPFSAADVTLDGRLNLNDVLAFGEGWGADGSALSLEQRVLQGDLDFDGDTDADDWDLFHARWVRENNAPLSLQAVLNPIAGDYNYNGRVTQADYDVWLATYGSTDSLAADGNGDGVVNSADYSVWRERQGETNGDPPVVGTLVLYIDPDTGAGTLKNDSAATIDLAGYSLLSTDGALLASDGQWNSLADQQFSGWDEAAPTASVLSELNAFGSTSLAPGDSVELGELFDLGFEQRGLTLEFYAAGDSAAQLGAAVFSEFIDSVPVVAVAQSEAPEAAAEDEATVAVAPPTPAAPMAERMYGVSVIAMANGAVCRLPEVVATSQSEPAIAGSSRATLFAIAPTRRDFTETIGATRFRQPALVTGDATSSDRALLAWLDDQRDAAGTHRDHGLEDEDDSFEEPDDELGDPHVERSLAAAFGSLF